MYMFAYFHVLCVRKEKFEQDHIYARFYLPDIFPIERFIYLDNDVFVTADLAELSDTPLYGNIYTNIPADAVSEPARLNKKVSAYSPIRHLAHSTYIARLCVDA